MSLVSLLAVLLLAAGLAVLVLFWATWRACRERRREAVLREAADAQYRQLTTVADLCYAVLDAAGQVLDWNPTLEKVYGCSRRQALGQPFLSRFVPPGEMRSLGERIAAMRASDEVFEFSFVVPQAAGLRPCRLRWRARHFTDFRAGQRCLSLVGHDVTTLEFALAQLESSEARFRMMFESVPVALALIDLEGRLRMVNSECARFFAYDAPEQMVALHVEALIQHAEDREASALALAALRARTDAQFQLECSYLRRDGVVRWGNARIVLVELDPAQTFFLAQISDVHERKQTERALLESERRQATLIANLSGAVYRYELPPGPALLHHDCRPEFLSNGVEHLTGLAPAQFLQAPAQRVLGSLILAEDREAVVQSLRRAMAGDGRFEVSYRLQQGGGWRWVVEHGLAWQRPDGSWTVDGLLTDITAERQAREAEQVYRTLVADTRTGYVSLSASGLVLDVNEPFCSLLGLGSPDRVLGHALQPLLAAGYGGELERFLERILGEGGVHDIEFSYRRSDGQYRNCVVTAIAVPEGEQRVVKCLLMDASRIRQAERARRESEMRYRTLFDTSIDGIAFLSLEGRIEAVNPALCRLLGRSDTELLGRCFRDFTPPAWRRIDAQAKEQIMGRGSCDAYRKTLWRHDESEVEVYIQAWLVRDGNEAPQRIMSMVREAVALPWLPRHEELPL